MRTVHYGFFGEDRGQRKFLAAYLLHCDAQDSAVAFESVEYFGKKFGPMNNKVVDRECAAACREAFVLGYPLLDWLFVGRDVDSFDPARHQYLSDTLRASISDQWRARTLLMLPVQCVEHWLLYLAQYPEREVLEKKPNDQTKKAVYADLTKSRDVIASELTATLSPERITWLAEVSASFLAFHQQVKAYLAALELQP